MSDPFIIVVAMGAVCFAFSGWLLNQWYIEASNKIRPLWFWVIEAIYPMSWVGLGFALIIAAKECQP
jgi:hypothetical protein